MSLALPSSELTKDNCVFLMIDHQVGLMQFLTSIDPIQLKNNILGHARTAEAFDIPVVMGTNWPQGPNGPTLPELKALFPYVDVIDRPFVNFWNDAASRKAIEATGRNKLIISGLATEVCVALPAIAALRDGYETYVVVDACADFNPLITQVTMQRLASAGVIVTTWIAVLAEIAANTNESGDYIGEILSAHNGQYYAAMNNFLCVAKGAEAVKKGVRLTGHPPIPVAGL